MTTRSERTQKTAASVETPQRRLTLGLFLDNLTGKYQNTLLQGLDDLARECDFNLLCFVGGGVWPSGQPANPNNVLYELLDKESLDGLVIPAGSVGTAVDPHDMQIFCERFRPLPQASIAMALEGIPSVLLDNYSAMRASVQHLVAGHGYRRLAFFHKQEGHPENDARYQAYVDVLTEHGIPVDPQLIVPGAYYNTPEAGVRLLFDERQLRPRLDVEALVVIDDGTALMVLNALQARGIRVPDDVALVGFDDIEDSRYVTPPLTTVRQPLQMQARRAAELVLAQLRGEAVDPQVLLPAELVVRRSCGCLEATILQARVEASGYTPADAVLPFEAALLTRREAILTDIARDVSGRGDGDPIYQQIVRQAGWLIDAFVTALKAGEAGSPSEIFLWVLDEILRQAMQEQRDVMAWQDGISTLRRYALSCAGVGTLCLQIENLLQQARVMVGAAAQQAQAFQRLQAGRRDQTLREIGQNLITATHIEALLDVLSYELPRLEIPAAYISLYVNRQAPEAGSRLLFAYDRLREFEDRSGQRFSSYRLAPESLFPPDRRYSMIVFPLNVPGMQLGRVVFELGPLDGTIYTSLVGQISNALQGVFLTQQIANRAVQLQTAAEVARVASGVLDPDALIQQVVTLVRERFNLYYVGLFLVEPDPENPEVKWAVLRAGTGEAGAQMVAQGHRLLVGGTSMIGWCIANRQARIALDVDREVVRQPHPLLPDTRSELALPLISRGEIIGALTIQSAEEAAFSQEDITVLQAMADQLANAIQNARLYEALELEQYLMRTMMDNIPDHIYFKDRDSRFIRVSRSQSNRFGLRDPAEAIGKTDFDFFTEDHARPAFEDEQRIIRTGEPIIELEERETWADRPDTWVSTTKMPMRDRDGNIIGTFGISRDITARKMVELQLAAERNLLRTLIDSLPDFVYIKDRQSRFLINNIAHLRVMGAQTQEEVVGKTDFDVFPYEMAILYYTDEQRLMETGEPLIEHEEPSVNQSTGKEIWVSTTKIPLRDAEGQVIGLVGITRDITERRRTENLLRRRNLQLQTVAEVARTAGGVLDLETLMQQTVELLRAQLDLYYVGLFLVDVATPPAEFAGGGRRRWAVLRAGTGEAGAQMLARGHRLEVGGTSMIGQCVATGKARIALDVGTEAVRFDNPLLPNTRSELALPLISRGEIIGALTIQSTEPAAFSEEDIAVLQALADQLANAIANIRLFEQSQRALHDLEMIQRRYLHEAWSAYREVAPVADYEVARPGVPSLPSDAILPEVRAVAAEQRPVALTRADMQGKAYAALVAPITQRNEIIGALGIHDEDGGREWTEDEIALVETIAERMGIVAETLRLLEETQRTAGRERLTRQITDQIRSALSVDEAIQRALKQLGDALNAEMLARLKTDEFSV